MTVYMIIEYDIYELPLAICDSMSQSKVIKHYYESYKDIACKIEVIEI